ncbi:hypothetical protein RclHR1_04490003 [Rhizophagus clarus]|uniref:Uncharacterized protein n=1 Tax=Rhizophagus clarus TaxID=94130 RepID=A0A2Z6SBE8_9GLOM|nr:hypothetical protein RclHR1_04490003 [Rhizophagus clarus]
MDQLSTTPSTQSQDLNPTQSGKSNVTSGKSKSAKGKKFTRCAAEKTIAGTQVTDENARNVRHITVYDVPSEWTHEQILNALSTWGNTIKFSTKKQRKFQTLWVLFDEVRAHFDGGLWMYTFGNTPVRWFPGNGH